MKVTADDRLFEEIPGLCIGIIALRAADNRGLNREAELFRRRCCTEANLLLKMNPGMADGDIASYQKAFETLGEEGKSSALETVIREYKKGLGIAEEEETDDDIEILTAPKQASMDELAGSDILPRVNPVMDMVRGGMLKFHVDIHAYDMGRNDDVLRIERTENGARVTLGDKVSENAWLTDDEEAGAVNEDSENILVLITGFGESRKKVAVARNELARRLKSAFDRSVEVGWIEASPHEFTSAI